MFPLQIWLTVALVIVALVQAREIHERRKVAQAQLDFEREKFEYRKKLDDEIRKRKTTVN